MLGRLFPKQIDNDYRGYKLAIWLLVPIVLFKLVQGAGAAGLNPWVSNRFIATSADGFRLDTYGVEGASIVMFLFASWGLAVVVLNLLGAVVLIRYRAMIPFTYVLLSIEQFGRKGIQLVDPIVKVVQTEDVSSGFLFNSGIMAALLIGLALSLAMPRKGERVSVA